MFGASSGVFISYVHSDGKNEGEKNMTDTNLTNLDPAIPAPTAPTPDLTVTPPDTTADEKKFSQAELDAHIADRLKREKAKQAELIAEAKKKADADALVKNAEWQKLAEQRLAELDEAQTKIKVAETLEQKRKAASKHGLPEELIERLKGVTAEELEADAALIATLLKDPKKVPPNLPPTNPSGNSAITGESVEERRKRLGL